MPDYAVGDLQGCFDPLRRLLDRVAFDPTKDRLYCVGDLVNRGPQSLEVLRFLRGLGDAAHGVLGNHDLTLIMAHYGHGKRSKSDTFHHVLDAPDGGELIDWLRGLPMLIVHGRHVIVHAGLLPQWSVAQARELAGEVECALQGPQCEQFLRHMWGGTPTAWQDDLSGWDRLRVIVNAMTRMRFCTPEGHMEFHAKGPPERAPAGHAAWFDLPHAAWRTHTVVCGHWSAAGLRVAPQLIALDTGCLWGGCLSALRLGDGAIFQQQCRKFATGAE
ncbi:MAG: symmetrical bis(5'-nucleosyl)-tetraphosphatase [Rhodocyclaceae bacterium]|nr:symmetrical bis(5'-nucleosyl)-tetraphosphatase [Rhodocyclaceae bacterium]MBX3669140.1 symmetrical bis(5'-nucleosyl)-tetraphosphatase [Rhodocyclaceae bacterium]